MALPMEARALTAPLRALWTVRCSSGFPLPPPLHAKPTDLEGAQTGDTGGYGIRRGRYGGPDEGSSGSESSSGWNDLIGWIEEQGDEDTQGVRDVEILGCTGHLIGRGGVFGLRPLLLPPDAVWSWRVGWDSYLRSSNRLWVST